MFPDAVMHLKPLFTLLVLIYWNMALPDKVGISEALVIGLLLDILTGPILGLHALLFCPCNIYLPEVLLSISSFTSPSTIDNSFLLLFCLQNDLSF